MTRAFLPAPRSLQALSPEAARFCLGIERFCREYLHADITGKALLVAFSGGADSLALLYALSALRPKNGLRLGLGILDHGLREESAQEVLMAGTLAGESGIAFHTRRVDVASLAGCAGLGVEECGRNERFRFLDAVRSEHGYDWILTGHQLNDLAEDSLMRLIRGSAWPALAGMAALAPERAILRPMLLTPRRAVEAFLANLGASWVQDASNRDTFYFRNRVRHTLLPRFLEENPSFLEQVALRWRLARLDESFFQETLHLPEATEEGIFLERHTLTVLAPALRLRLFKAALDSLGEGQARTDALLRLHAAWEKGTGGKELRFPGGKRARVIHGGIRFRRGREKER